MRSATLKALLRAREQRHAVAVVTDLGSGAERLVTYGQARDDELGEALVSGFRFDRSGVVSFGGREHFINIHNPPLRLMVVGAVHIAQALVPMAQAAGYDVSVIDPRGAFATPERFPGVALMTDWPDEALASLSLDQRTAVAALTHDPKIDDPALLAAAASECFYVGALGSRRNHASRLERLKKAGAKTAHLERICGPIGLDIGARGAPEIAVSILAEMTRTLRLGGCAGS